MFSAASFLFVFHKTLLLSFIKFGSVLGKALAKAGLTPLHRPERGSKPGDRGRLIERFPQTVCFGAFLCLICEVDGDREKQIVK